MPLAYSLDDDEMCGRFLLDWLACVMQSREAQIMNLLHLAPNIQEEILIPAEGYQGMPVHEHMLRGLCAEMDWEKQRQLWKELAAGGIWGVRGPVHSPSPALSASSASSRVAP